jgi:hypothetical protein
VPNGVLGPSVCQLSWNSLLCQCYQRELLPLFLLLQVELRLSDGIPLILPLFLLESSRWESSCCCFLISLSFLLCYLGILAFLASSSFCASPIVSPACNAWPKMVVKDANPSGVLISIVNSYEALKWSATIFLNLSSLVSPPLDPKPPPPVPTIAIRNLLCAQPFLRQFLSNVENEFKFTRRFTLSPQRDFTTPSRESIPA